MLAACAKISLMDQLSAARVLIGDSLGFHLFFIILGVGLPVLLNILEFYAWRRKSQPMHKFVRLLTRWIVILVVAGAISGTMISMQFTLLWAPFMKAMQPHVGKFFILEGYSFLIEAVFLAWYVLREGKMSPGRHWLVGLMISVGALGSTVFITSVNAWMNNPSNIVTSTTYLEILHSAAGYIFASILVTMGFVAWRILRSKPKDSFPYWLLARLALIGIVSLVFVAVLGDMSARNLASTQPVKFAAIEAVDKTQVRAPLMVGGQINEQGKASGGIEIPALLSLMTHFNPNAKIEGLDAVPRDRWPILIIHSLFEVKMLLIGFVSALVVIIPLAYWRKWQLGHWFLWLTVLGGLAGFTIVELGWMLTELGRQPWAIHGMLLTADAFTKSVSAIKLGFIFPSFYLIMIAGTLFALTKATSRWRKQEDILW